MMSAQHFNKTNFNPRPMRIKSWSHLGQLRMVRKHCLKSSCTGLVVAAFSSCCNVNYRFNLTHTGATVLPPHINITYGVQALWHSKAIIVLKLQVLYTFALLPAHVGLCVCNLFQYYVHLHIIAATFPRFSSSVWRNKSITMQ